MPPFRDEMSVKGDLAYQGLEQLLPGGQLAITIEPDKGQRYQGVVPLVDNSLAHSLELYYEHGTGRVHHAWFSRDADRNVQLHRID